MSELHDLHSSGQLGCWKANRLRAVFFCVFQLVGGNTDSTRDFEIPRLFSVHCQEIFGAIRGLFPYIKNKSRANSVFTRPFISVSISVLPV